MSPDLLLKEYFLTMVSNDYENIDFLKSQITQWANNYQRTFSYESLVALIHEVIAEGLVSAYKFNADINAFEKSPFKTDAINDYWFLKTGSLGFPHNL